MGERTWPGKSGWEGKDGECHFVFSGESSIDVTMMEFAHIFETDFMLINSYDKNPLPPQLLSGNEKQSFCGGGGRVTNAFSWHNSKI